MTLRMDEPGMSTTDQRRRFSLDTLLDGIAALCVAVAGAMLVFLIVTFGWLVFGRYVLNDTPTWVEQSSLVLVVWITCLGAAAGVRQEAHLNIAFIRDALSGLPRMLMYHLADLFVIVFGIFMAWQGGLMVLNNTGRAIPMIGIPESFRAAPLVVCGVLMVLFSGVALTRRLVIGERT